MQHEEPQEILVKDEVTSKTQGIVIGQHGLTYNDMPGLWRIAKMICVARLNPKGLDTPEALCIAIAKGRSVGILDPFQAIESVGIINGKACLYGDAPLAIARQHPAWDEAGFEEYWELDGKRMETQPLTATDDTAAVCVTRRKRGKPRIERFSVADAKRAKLWGKDGPWTNYWPRMLKFRARGFNLRDNFGDALKGLYIRELYEGDEINNGHGASNVTALNEKIQQKQSISEAIANAVVETIDIKPQEATPVPEPPKEPRQQSVATPKRRNNSPAFNDAKLTIQMALSAVSKNEPQEIVEEILKEASYKDGDYITIDDLENSIGKLDIFQQAASNLRKMADKAKA